MQSAERKAGVAAYCRGCSACCAIPYCVFHVLPPPCSLSVAEVFIAPAMPSTTARAGGIFMPIINSLSLSAGSKPSECRAVALLRYCCNIAGGLLLGGFSLGAARLARFPECWIMSRMLGLGLLCSLLCLVKCCCLLTYHVSVPARPRSLWLCRRPVPQETGRLFGPVAAAGLSQLVCNVPYGSSAEPAVHEAGSGDGRDCAQRMGHLGQGQPLRK